jgi:hypothetical protein
MQYVSTTARGVGGVAVWTPGSVAATPLAMRSAEIRRIERFAFSTAAAPTAVFVAVRRRSMPTWAHSA